MKKNDLILIVAALLAAFAFFILNPFLEKSGRVKIMKNGRFFCEKSLSDSCEIDIDGKNIAVIENGEVYMKYADCPDKLCIKQGKIKDSSKKIVCLPNRVIIEADAPSETDTVVR